MVICLFIFSMAIFFWWEFYFSSLSLLYGVVSFYIDFMVAPFWLLIHLWMKWLLRRPTVCVRSWHRRGRARPCSRLSGTFLQGHECHVLSVLLLSTSCRHAHHMQPLSSTPPHRETVFCKYNFSVWASLAPPLLFPFHVKIGSGKFPSPACISILMVPNQLLLFLLPLGCGAYLGELCVARFTWALCRSRFLLASFCSPVVGCVWVYRPLLGLPKVVCFLFSFLLLGNFQEKYFSFRGRNTNC